MNSTVQKQNWKYRGEVTDEKVNGVNLVIGIKKQIEFAEDRCDILSLKFFSILRTHTNSIDPI